MSGDTWKEIQATRNRNLSFRERREKRKLETQSIIAQALGTKVARLDTTEPSGKTDEVKETASSPPHTSTTSAKSADDSGSDIEKRANHSTNGNVESLTENKADHQTPAETKEDAEISHDTDGIESNISSPVQKVSTPLLNQEEVERYLLETLEEVGITIDLPTEFTVIESRCAEKLSLLEKKPPAPTNSQIVETLEKFSAQGVITISCADTLDKTLLSSWKVLDCVHSRISASLTALREDFAAEWSKDIDDSELLSMQTLKERIAIKVNAEIAEILHRKTFNERMKIEKYKSRNGALVRKFCQYETREMCEANKKSGDERCTDLHFRKIIQAHTDISLGDCSFLNTCFHVESCKYIHYEIDQEFSEDQLEATSRILNSEKQKGKDGTRMIKSYVDEVTFYPPQWIQCDVRHLDMSTLGKFAVLMADPPWDIHMELPYGTMSDHEMKTLGIPCLQDSGYMFLWVTGRAMETGRECLRQWGYRNLGEILWVKTNQLQRIIRTGRTGHWLNHGKEHCLIGVKGNPKNMNKGLDCDVIVSEVRATSHKPDEIYGIIERLSPGTRKLELFGRPHNVQPNWVTLGNQLDGVRLIDPEVVARFRAKYPNGIVTKS